VLGYIGIGVLISVVYYLTLRIENARRDRGIRDEIIDGVNDNGMFIHCCAWPAIDRPASVTQATLRSSRD
jgi:hypothetical protein